MEINAILCEGNYDFSIKLKENNDEPVFELTIGNQILTITADEWRKIDNLVENAMDFLENNDDIEK